MNSKDLVRATLQRQSTDRIPIYDSFWTEVRDDYHQQIVPADMKLEDYFNFDLGMFWFEQSFLLPEETISVEGDKRVFRDQWGTLNEEIIGKQTTPGLLEFALKNREDWENNYKEYLVYQPDRIDWKEIRVSWEHIQGRQQYGVLSMLGPYECAWHMVGAEEQLLMIVTDPEWLVDIYDACTTLIEEGWRDLVKNGIKPDGLWLYEDIAYNHGMLFSPQHYRELLKPFHRRLAELAHSSGSELIYHSDGDISRVIPDLIDLGADCLHPLEAKAGLDVRELKKTYGDDICLMGNIDARLFEKNDLAGLEAEIRSKISEAKVGGGYIYHSDHSIPPETRLETYQYALDLVREVGKY